MTDMESKFDPPLQECPLCDSTLIHLYHVVEDGIRVFRCRDCRVQFMNPQYTDAHLADYYSRYTQEEPEWDEPLRHGHHSYLSLVEQFQAPGRMLDVGSGKGHLLEVAKARGWVPTGYEIDPVVARNVAGKIGVEVRSGDFPTLDWPRQSFDLVVMHHVIEHLKSPVPYLSTIRSMLKPRGILFLVLPNIRSRSALWKLLLERLHLRRSSIGSYYDVSHHLWYYSPRTMRHLLERLGFSVLHVRSGFAVRPHQSRLKRLWMAHVSDRIPWKSTFVMIARLD